MLVIEDEGSGEKYFHKSYENFQMWKVGALETNTHNTCIVSTAERNQLLKV